MQLTRFDRWLRERFVYETHIKTLRAPEAVPKGIRAQPLPDIPGVRFKHLFVARNTQLADSFIASLREANLMFFTSVVDRKAWFVPWIAPKNKSLTWILAWIVLASISACYVVGYLVNLLSQPALRQMLAEAIETLKG
ncbi:MAG: hypothetical protein DVB26_06695 [Verrucomicrobia bacterium]|nr:MAG: hypothetical protein DVB26_06695 [Verrucomicrobiota bacterium]